MSTEGEQTTDRGDSWTPTDDADDTATKLGKVEEVVVAKLDEAEKPSALKVETKVDEPKADDKKVDEPKDDKKARDARIPLARHEAVLTRERQAREAVEAELAQYKQGAKIVNLGEKITAAETSLVALEQTYAKHLLDNEAEKAAAVMTQIRRAERAINEQTSQVREEAAEARAVERVRFDTTVDRLEALYPALNVAHDDFDKEKTAEVLELKEAYQTRGYTPSAALQKAVKLIMPPETKAQETALKTEARVDPAAVEAARKAAAVAKTTDAIGKTPLSSGKVGADSDKAGGGQVTAKDAIKMPYNEFVKLDEAALARMRGDVL